MYNKNDEALCSGIVPVITWYDNFYYSFPVDSLNL